jgi:hypothetical protein
MNVIGHDDVAYDHEAITLADFFEHCEEQIASLRTSEPALPVITTTSDEVQLVGAIKAPGMLGHSASLLVAAKKSCDIRPCRSHLYKKRKGGPASQVWLIVKTHSCHLMAAT